jgi:2-oxoglutarate dehydrogenase complex dehydrogenase (E1) component-like enzyme
MQQLQDKRGVYEIVQMAQLEGYKRVGTIHIVVK